MKVSIYSRETIESIIENGLFPLNSAVITFYDPAIKRIDKDYTHVNYDDVCDSVFYSELDDLDLEVLKTKGYTYDTYFPEADDIAVFVYQAHESGMDIICQCEYGQSRTLAVPRRYWSISIIQAYPFLQTMIIIQIR